MSSYESYLVASKKHVFIMTMCALVCKLESVSQLIHNPLWLWATLSNITLYTENVSIFNNFKSQILCLEAVS